MENKIQEQYVKLMSLRKDIRASVKKMQKQYDNEIDYYQSLRMAEINKYNAILQNAIEKLWPKATITQVTDGFIVKFRTPEIMHNDFGDMYTFDGTNCFNTDETSEIKYQIEEETGIKKFVNVKEIKMAWLAWEDEKDDDGDYLLSDHYTLCDVIITFQAQFLQNMTKSKSAPKLNLEANVR